MLLREAAHRSANDLQLVLGMLALHARRARHPETRAVLDDVIERVTMIARSRSVMQNGGTSLRRSLDALCDGLEAQAEPRGIALSCDIDDNLGYYKSDQIMVLTLIVNELAVNAIKHAFTDRASGRITISARRDLYSDLHITIDDDGAPFAVSNDLMRKQGGLELVQQLAKSIGAIVDFPDSPGKAFKITLPAPPV